MVSENIAYVNTLHTFDELMDVVSNYIFSQSNRDLIIKAYEYSKNKHEGQTRRSGEPYIHHLIEVGYILATLQAGPSTIIAGILHDVIEDTDTSIEEIGTLFGDDIMMIVDSLTKIQRMKLSHRPRSELAAEDHRKIFLGMAKDIRVIIIKLADRLHNMRTIEFLPPDRQAIMAKETLEVYSPIAHRLGIGNIKNELENLSLKYLHPEKYNEINRLLDEKTRYRTKSLESLKKRIADILFDLKIPFEIVSRIKSVYSIYKKIYLKQKNFDQIYDVLALRIITANELNCYEILGLIHATFKPLPGRFKDYIAVPKPNMYQSLHTCIISGDGNIYEIQIRTEQMNEVAESGIAAHWKYKEGKAYNPKAEQKEIEEKLHWFRDFVALSDENSDEEAQEYIDSLKRDIFESSVYIFTPKGKVVDLPNGSTPLDFAYKIHTRVAEQAIGATVNNILVPLNTVLKSGDVVEIRTSTSSKGPNEGWLKIVATSNAKSHIKKFLMKKNADFTRDDKIAKGRISLLDAFKELGFTENEMLEKINNKKFLDNYGADSIDDLYLLISSRNPSPGGVIEKLNLKKKVEAYKLAKNAGLYKGCPVNVGNIGSVAVNLGHCCTPIPGDDIKGYITRGKGITIHRVTCPNIANETNRLIDVTWREDLQLENYPVDIELISLDRPLLLNDVMSILSQNRIPCTYISAKLHITTSTTTISATINVSDANKLNNIFNILLNINGVLEVNRVIH